MTIGIRTWPYCVDPCSDGCCSLVDILEDLYEEVEFLYTRGILKEKALGRTEDVFISVRDRLKAAVADVQ